MKALVPSLAATLLAGALAAQAFPQPRFRELPRNALPRRASAGTGCDGSFTICSTDVDGDGDLDLVLGGLAGGGVFSGRPDAGLYLNDGHARFSEVSATHLPQIGLQANDIAAADLDGDGDNDLLFAVNVWSGWTTPFVPNSFVLFNDGTGHYGQPQWLPNSGGAHAESGELADVDGDGDLDVIFAGSSPPLELLLNDGQGGFTDVTASHIPAISSRIAFLCARAADIDGDGDLDLITTPTYGPTFFLNDGTGHFTEAPYGSRIQPTPPAAAFLSLSLADVEGDGDVDFMVATFGNGSPWWLFLNDGTGHFIDATATNLPADPGREGGFNFLDADLDGDLDLMVNRVPLVGVATGEDAFYRNDGTGHFTDATAEMLPVVLEGEEPDCAIGDFDGDGDPDLALANAQYGGPNPICHTPLYLNQTRQLYTPAAPAPGQTYDAEVYGPSGSWSVLMVAAQPASIALPPFGTFGLAPNAHIVLPAALQLSATGSARWTLHLPPDPSLTGKSVFVQSLLVDLALPTASRLTNVVLDVVQ